ncbi:hypothetical protein PHYSODRAFT_294242 [Phytophthora sojae]|uniref:Uncharacterized protein n=1 Tax=Phytophthora sojae (strain P6497) TaxID=1094619 RepID=G4YIY3_PHYSP|nr:hypothetical protein PHYSODRAFT_294242 [Phytophthora sojae]EGZ28805.1 hypothetical protein PHYSODRAFT_294242 [Phytophthora sojae]|eukprot:XP_009516080.1 hypothetical protein PHYSODRAFT_294242 [Phytophthora sojae]
MSSKRQRREDQAPAIAHEQSEPVLLTSVSVGCRDARPQLQSLAHVGFAINAFLDLRSVALACSMDSVALLRHIIAGYEKTPATSVQRDPLFRQIHFSRGMKAACKEGHLSAVQWLALSPYFAACFMPTEAVRSAVQHGHLSILEWLHANRNDICWRRCFTAVDGNHLDITKWLMMMTGRDESRGRMWIVPAARAGNLEIVKRTYKLKGKTPAKTREAVGAAAINGHVNVVQWLLEQKAAERKCIGFAERRQYGNAGDAVDTP